MVKMNWLQSTVKIYSGLFKVTVAFWIFTVDISKLHYPDPESNCNFEMMTVKIQKAAVNFYSQL